MRQLLKKTIIAIAVIALIGTPMQVLAQEGKELDPIHYIENDILFYDPQSEVCTSAGAVDASSGKIPSGYKPSEDILNGAGHHKDVYQKVSEKTGVPAAVFAVLHSRESSFGLKWPANGQGIYQFYPDTSWPRNGTASPEQFEEQTELVFTRKLVEKMDFASKQLKQLGHPVPDYDVKNAASVAAAYRDENFLKAVLFAYNGWAGVYEKQAENLGFKNEPWEGSPYVMNLWDDARNGTQATEKNKWGQIMVDNGPIEYPANDAVGAFTLYVALGGAVEGGSACDGSVGGGLQDVVRIALAEFEKGIKEVPLGSNGGDDVKKYTAGHEWAWCASFVSWVYKEAGVPFTGGANGGWHYSYTVALQDYFKDKQHYFDVGKEDPQPGDVAFYFGAQTPDGGSKQHVNIVISYNKANNTMVTVGGNESDKVSKTTKKVVLGAESLVGFGRMK